VLLELAEQFESATSQTRKPVRPGFVRHVGQQLARDVVEVQKPDERLPDELLPRFVCEEAFGQFLKQRTDTRVVALAEGKYERRMVGLLAQEWQHGVHRLVPMELSRSARPSASGQSQRGPLLDVSKVEVGSVVRKSSSRLPGCGLLEEVDERADRRSGLLVVIADVRQKGGNGRHRQLRRLCPTMFSASTRWCFRPETNSSRAKFRCSDGRQRRRMLGSGRDRLDIACMALRASVQTPGKPVLSPSGLGSARTIDWTGQSGC
jgi:hypothetical protein